MANAVIAVAGKITDFILVPVLKKYLRPFFYFKTIVDDFEVQNRRLTEIQESVGAKMQRARDNAQVIFDGVEEWMRQVNTSMQEAQGVEDGLRKNKRCFCYSWCPNWTCHYSFSKKVSKITVTMKILIEEGNSLSSISHTPTLHRGIIRSSSCTAFMHSQTPKSAFVEIMEALKSDDVKVIGLYGEAGMGKTMLANQVAEEAQKHPEHFKHVIIVNVSQDQQVEKIQGIIADYLQLRLEQESVDGRASKLKLRLESGEKILLILDGVWKEFDVGAIGIHSSNSGCKVLYTAHSRSHVPDGLQTQSYVQLSFLPEDEAWDLVQSIASIGDQVRTHAGAKNAIAESKGHPKFVMMLGRALRGKNLSEWDEALEPLRVAKFKATEDLEEQAKKLSLRRDRVKNEIKIAKDNVEEINEDVDNWLIDVEKAMKDKEQFMNEFNKNIYFFDEHGDVTKVEELTVSVKKLCSEGNFVKVSYASPLHQVLGSSSSEHFMPSQSAIFAFNKILEALQKNDANIIGLYGMGGIGKTTLAVQVQREVERTKIFDHTIMVTISQRPEVRSIQGTIADFLNLKLEQETEEGRARKLNKRLKDEKVLVILDDLWKQFDLRSIGIVLDECKGCKILLTTRRKEVCNSMDCQPKIELHLFSEDESQEFFKKKAGLSNLNDVAKQIVGECKCLPIALATVGAALKNKGRDEWMEALEKLKNARLPDIIGVDDDEKNVYKCLLFSYEYLKRSTQASQAPFMLLLCSLFPEDSDIAVENLTRYAFGMNLFERVGSIEDARRKVRVTIRFLKDSCLLLGTNEETFVKMHDMVRDAMLWTGGKEVQERKVLTVRDDIDLKDLIKKKSFQDCRAVSFMPDVIPNLSKCNELEFPNLEVVLIFIKEKENLDADGEGFFQHMQVLKVLDINGLGIWNTFAMPQSLDCLKDLRTLLSRWCRFSNSSILGNLEKLEILSLYNCEIDCGVDLVSGLKELRLLDSTGLKAEKMFTSTGIGELVNLEELHGHIFTECNLCELKLLTNLVALSVKIEDVRCIPTGFCFPSLESYDICIGIDMHRSTQWLESLRLCRLLQLIGNFGDKSAMINTCKKLLPSVQVLYFEGCEDLCSLSAFNSHTEGLERLEVKKCNKMKWVFEFQLTSLKILKLEELHKLEQVWKGVIRPLSLCNLIEIHIVKCSKLVRVFSSSLVVCLEQLAILKISHCSKLEEIVSSRGASDDEDGFCCCCCFTNLRELEVSGCQKLKTIFPIVKSARIASRLHPHPQSHCRLPELQSIVLTHNYQLEHIFNHHSQAEEGVECPSLQVLKVTQSPKISTTHFVATQLQVPSLKLLQDNSMDYIQEVEEQLQRTIICFSYLQRVELIECEKLKQVFTISLVTSLQQLEALIIRGCHELEQVISMGDDGREEPTIGVCFENLKTLEVCSCGKLKEIFPIPITLPKLEKFQLHNNAELEHLFGPSDKDCTWQCPILKDLSIQDCPKMSRQFGACIQNMSKAKAKHVKLGEIKGMEEIMQIETLTCHLYTLSLRNLEDLKCIWRGPTQNICFADLGVLDVHGCNWLKHVLETSIVAALPRLSTLSVKRCNELEQVIVMAKNGKELSVGVVFEKLRFLEVSECGKLKTIFPFSIALPRLESLRLEGNAELEHVFGRSDLDCTKQYPFMKNLCLKDCPKLCTVQHPSPSKLVGENLYGLVEKLEHDNAAKLTGILLEMDETQVQHLIKSPQALKAKVTEANEILRTFTAQQANSPTDVCRHRIDNNSDNDSEEEAFWIWA